ncbi:MAG: HD domain-containing protein [Methanomassiliicoccales archaeon]|nr:HD domain-containing protein [Methanomassiliicoccales archaeon]
MSMPERKIIHDSVHGSVKVNGVFLEILHRPEMQRLHGIKQLGLAHLVFPGANHTRFEHSLGTYHVADLMCQALGLQCEDRDQALAAALLHDVGHAPFSHTLEEVLENRFSLDHMDLGVSLIDGERDVIREDERKNIGTRSTIAEVLDRNGISSEAVTDIIVSPGHKGRRGQSLLMETDGQSHFNSHEYLHQMIHGPVDADQMDYLLRDAHYTGVAHGAIDIDRLMQTIELYHGDIVVRKGGMVAAEGMMVARALMYTSVYYHKTVRIAEMMLCKAVELADDSIADQLQRENDASLTERLMRQGGCPQRLVTMLKYRELYKRAYAVFIPDMSDEDMSGLLRLTDYRKRKEVESLIADRASVDVSEIILDVPKRELITGEARRGKTEVPILNGDKVRPLTRLSPISKALQLRGVQDWAVMVSCPADKVARVEKVASRTIADL